MDTELSSHNVGHAMLLKMGWMPGKGLGVEGNGRVQPVPISEKRGADLTGIGAHIAEASDYIGAICNTDTLYLSQAKHPSIASPSTRQRHKGESSMLSACSTRRSRSASFGW